MSVARRLFARGYLWNSFVMVGWVARLLSLVNAAAPDLTAAFQPVERALGSADEAEALERTYERLPAINFSDRVLVRVPGYLVTVRARGVEWSDWGDPRRVMASLRRGRCQPSWLDRMELQADVGGT